MGNEKIALIPAFEPDRIPIEVLRKITENNGNGL